MFDCHHNIGWFKLQLERNCQFSLKMDVMKFKSIRLLIIIASDLRHTPYTMDTKALYLWVFHTDKEKISLKLCKVIKQERGGGIEPIDIAHF